jgi:hypothetical protein
MHADIDDFLKHTGGVGEYSELARAVGKVALDGEIRSGALVRVFPRTYARPWDADDVHVRDMAAVLSVGGDAAISAGSALRRWRLPVPADERIHVIVSRTSRPRSRHPELVVHRTKLPTASTDVDGVPTQLREDAIAWAWTELRGAARRAPAITAVRQGEISTQRLRLIAKRAIRMKGRRQLLDLTDLLDAGCESELEIWGYGHVFDEPDLRDANRQLRLRVGTRRYRLDMAFEAEKLAVELDGRAYHSSDEQRERDIARDVALATLGWQTIRLSHHRLTTDPEGCRRDVRRVRAARRVG